MALRFIDSFDTYASAQMIRKWNTAGGASTIVPGAGRNGTQACRVSGSPIVKTLDSQPTWVVGGAFMPGTLSGQLITLTDVGASQIGIVLRGDGTLGLVRGGSTTLGTSGAFTMSINTYYYIELKVTIGASSPYEVRVNNVVWITGTGNTRATANSSSNGFVFGSSGGSSFFHLDDLYICDGTGAIRNDFLGDVMATPIYPSGAGDLTDWTPIFGSNWQNVNEAIVTDDATFNFATSAGQVDLYAMQDLPYSPAAILGIQWNGEIRKTDASSYILNSAVKFGTVHYGTTGFAPNVSYVNYTDVYAQNPDTSADFTISDINAMQAGVKLYSIT